MSRPAIAQHRINWVLKLLRGGMSQRKASIVSGVSLPIVGQIANGQRQPAEQYSEDEPVKFQKVKPYTCPTCERLVTTAPCVACASKRGA